MSVLTENKKKGWQYFLKKAVLFLLLVVAADFIIGSVLQHFFYKQSSGWEYRTKYSIEDTKADALIFGASRAQQQYNPTNIEDSLLLTAYNVGRDGMPFLYHYAVLQAILKRYTPKLIILDVEYNQLVKAESSYDRISCLLPYYRNHPELRPIIELRGKSEKYKLLSKIYPYNSLALKILAGNTESNKKKHEDIKGYVQLTRSLNQPLHNVVLSESYELDTVKLNMFNSFISDCKSRNIKLFFVCPPYYMNTIGKDHSMETIRRIAIENKIEFFDYAKDTFFLSRPKLFDDTVHVNATGSKILSAMIASDIKRSIASGR